MPERLGKLRRREEFLRVAAARRKWVSTGLILQVCPGPQTTDAENATNDSVRVGFTASKKVGNAVHRNRAKRRLRALAREVLAAKVSGPLDIVLIAREETVHRPYDVLRGDIEYCLRRLGMKAVNAK